MLQKCFPIALLAALAPIGTRAQDVPDVGPEGNLERVAMPHYVKVERAFYRGDSIPSVRLVNPIYKYPPKTFGSERERQRYNRLVSNVKRLLPMAKLARYTIIETYNYVETLPDAKSKNAHWKRVEQSLVAEYKPVMKKMTRTQGKLLLKLIDRECNQTGLNIAEAFLGSGRAYFYQSIGWVFGINLNKHYDPEGEDRETERICRLVESGQM